MVGNAVWGQITGSGTLEDPYTGEGSLTITATDGGNVYLENATITNSSYILDLANLNGNFTIHVSGVCELGSPEGDYALNFPASKKPNHTLTIDGDGLLRIYGIEGDDTGASKTGDFIIKGATVYFLGTIGHDDNSGNHGTIDMQGGIAFVEGGLSEPKDPTHSGILFQKDGGNTWYGTLYSDYKIGSNIQADIDGDGQPNDDPIEINLNGRKLSLGDGVVIDNRTGNFEVNYDNGGSFLAFTVKYDNNPVKAEDNPEEAPINESYYGTNANIWLEKGIKCNAEENQQPEVHQFLGWVKDGDTNIHSAYDESNPENRGSIETPSNYDPNQTRPKEIVIKAAWAAFKRTIYTTEGQEMQPVFLADTPEGIVTYQETSSDMPNGISFTASEGKFSGTPSENSEFPKTYTVNVSFEYTLDGTETTGNATVTINHDQYKPDLSSATITVTEEFTYNGIEQFPVKLILNGNEMPPALYTVTYTFQARESSSDVTSEEDGKVIVKQAGTYTITAINPTELAQGTINIENLSTKEITVNPRTLKFKVRNQTVELDGEKQPNKEATLYDTNFNTDGTIRLLTGDSGEDNIVSGEVSEEHHDIFNGTLIVDDYTTVGTYSISASGVTLKDDDKFLTNNYVLAETDGIAEGTLTVTDNLSDDDVETEIDNNDGEDAAEFENGTITLTYDGLSHAITSVKKKGNETALNADTDYGISYTYKATADAEAIEINLEEGGEVKDAGTYTATISFTGSYSESENVTRTIIINKRPLTITTINQTIYVGTTEEGKQTEVNKTPTFGQAEGNTLTVSNIVSIEETAENVTFSTGELGLSEVVSAAISAETPGKYEDAITQGSLALADDNDANANYTISTDEGATFTPGDLTIIRVLSNDDQDDMIGGDDGDGEDEDGNFTGDNDYILVGDAADVTYSGQPYELKDLYWEADGKKTKVTIAEVTYAVNSEVENNTATTLNDDEKAVDAGHYTATVKVTSSTEEGSENYFETSDSESLVFKFEIKQASLTVTGSYECEETPTTVSASDVTDLEATGLVNNEQVSFSGTLKVDNNNLVPDTDFKMEAAESTAFKASNYNITYNITLTITGEGGEGGEDDDKTELDPNGDDKDNTTGGDEGDDNEFPSDDDFILLSPNGTGAADVYDGQEHGLTILKIGGYTLREGTDYNEIETYTPTNADQANVGSNGLPKHVNTYSAEITLVEGSGYKWPNNETSYTLTGMTINERPMLISFVSEVASEADLRDINKLVQYEPMAGDRGLVLYEQPIVEATISNVTELGNGHYRVTIDRESFTISNNEGNFYLSDYTIALDADGDDSGDYNVTDEDNDGTGGLDDGDGSGDGDITIDVTIDPNKPNFPDFGGGGIHKPIEYYNIYIDTVCPGIKLELSRDVVKGGNEVSAYLTIQSECDTTGMRFEYKRGLFGWWEDLKPLESAQPGEYVIKNIYTDIYIRALDATMPDATGLEEVEGVKAYAQDGSIYVYTPNRMPVWIVSMTGAVLRNEEQVGLQAYNHLTRGIYIVRVGEQVFKIRL